jgi:DNA processing protein
MSYDERYYWLTFSLISGIGIRRVQHLLQNFDSLKNAWQAAERELASVFGEKSARAKFVAARQMLDLEAELRKFERCNAWFIAYSDPEYPDSLKQLPDAPLVLYGRGEFRQTDLHALAVVGTRKPTKYGLDAAFDLSSQLASAGLTIISGLAPGIDAAAHQGALRVQGRTIAICGCGVDIVYPREHEGLATQIIESGALMSEVPLGMPPDARNFPRRNRIISGLSQGVLVVEAPESSGALITANLAAEQGRDVFAVPASIYNTTGRGTNRLIQDGAKLVTSADDILTEFNLTVQLTQARQEVRKVVPANETEAEILKLLDVEPLHIDEVVRLSGLSTAVVGSTLTILELKGLVQMVGHMQYSLNHRNS